MYMLYAVWLLLEYKHRNVHVFYEKHFPARNKCIPGSYHRFQLNIEGTLFCLYLVYFLYFNSASYEYSIIFICFVIDCK